MKKVSYIVIAGILLLLGFYTFNSYIYNEKQGDPSATPETGNKSMTADSVQVIPISHASLILQWGDKVIYADPTGGAKAYEGKPKADVILITDIHGDHLHPETVEAVLGGAVLIVPQAVKEMLPENLAGRSRVISNGESADESGFNISAIPMYNLPEASDNRHLKGRGNGYIIEKGGKRVYIAGDTAGIPEMRTLKNIDIAFVPMNLPFTMGVDEAASAVLDFKPKQVYPFHYRGQDGLADVNKFKELVNQGDPGIEVVLLNWYP